MKLLDHTAIYLSSSLLFIIGIWAVIFYFSMLDEVYDSIDDGLDNYRVLIIQKARQDSSVLHKENFDESNYLVHRIDEQTARSFKDSYKDTLMYMQNEDDFEPVRLLTATFSLNETEYFQLKIISSMVEEDDLIADLTYSLIWLYVTIIVSIVVINNVILRKIWKPFYNLIEQLSHFSLSENRSFTPPSTKVLEFKTLNDSLQNLLNKNIEIYESQKQFIENASHELQTPIAISTGKLELMLENPALNEDLAKNLSDILRTLERLSRLNKSLLLLSKIQNKQFLEKEPVNFNALVKQQLDELSQFLEYKELQFNLREHAIFNPILNKELAFILVTNLLKNAVVHSLHASTIVISISSSTFQISNSGDKPLHPEKLFQRFYKSSEKKGSTGLGLSIIKTISDLYNIKVQYTFNGEHNFKLSI